MRLDVAARGPIEAVSILAKILPNAYLSTYLPPLPPPLNDTNDKLA